MKKILIYIIISLITINLIYSQSPYVDYALQFSNIKYNGSARFLGMSGAFGALGGDISSISVNPAGLGIYRSSEFIFSPGLTYNEVSTSYYNNSMNNSKYQFSLNNMGFVASYDLEDSDTRWVNANFSIGYNRSNDFNNDITFEGVNNYSILEAYVNRANSGEWSPFYEELFWQVFLIDTLDNYPDPTEYKNVFTDTIAYDRTGFSINQRKNIKKEGSSGEFVFAFGANYAHKLYVGASIGISRLYYKEFASYYEYESANTADVKNFESMTLDEYGEIEGVGFTFKLGAIYKPIDIIRLGFSFHLPTFYDLEESFYSRVENGQDSYIETEISKYKYSLNTPMRLNAAVGVQVGKIALIDVDYEYVDYSTMKLDDDENSQDLINDNSFIEDLYKSTHNIRAGAEIRAGALYFRGGASYSTSPYSSTTINSDYNLIGYSGGLGYRQNNFFADFGFRHFINNYNYALLSVNPDLDIAKFEESNNNFVLTFGFKF